MVVRFSSAVLKHQQEVAVLRGLGCSACTLVKSVLISELQDFGGFQKEENQPSYKLLTINPLISFDQKVMSVFPTFHTELFIPFSAVFSLNNQHVDLQLYIW